MYQYITYQLRRQLMLHHYNISLLSTLVHDYMITSTTIYAMTRYNGTKNVSPPQHNKIILSATYIIK